MKSASRTIVGNPNPPPLAARCIGYPDRPGLSGSLGYDFWIFFGYDPNESDLRAARRKNGRRIAVETWAHPRNLFGAQLIDTNQGVTASIAAKCQPLAVRRPANGGDVALIHDEGLCCGFTCGGHHPNALLVDVYQSAAVGGEAGRMACADFARGPAVNRYDPHFA